MTDNGFQYYGLFMFLDMTPLV